MCKEPYNNAFMDVVPQKVTYRGHVHQKQMNKIKVKTSQKGSKLR